MYIIVFPRAWQIIIECIILDGRPRSSNVNKLNITLITSVESRKGGTDHII